MTIGAPQSWHVYSVSSAGFALALERARVLARLRMILAGEERPEEPAACGIELAAAVRAALRRERRQIVRLGDERRRPARR